MQLLNMKTKIHHFEGFDGFASEFKINKNDLILTHLFLYEPFMSPLNLEARVIIQENFGGGEPTDVMMNAILNEAKKSPYERVIAVGGGTVLDIAKLLILKDLTNVVDAFERKVPLEKACELIAVPTTCGTGSEVTNITIAELTTKQTKMGLADNVILPDDAVLIPDLMKGLPYEFYLYSSVDALIHGVESFLSPKANAYTRLFSIQGIEMILKIYQTLSREGAEQRFSSLKEMAIASNFAGIAFGSAGVGAVHAMSYPLGGKYHVPHGEANYQFFMAVLKRYQDLKPIGAIQELVVMIAKTLGCEKEQAFDELSGLLAALIPQKPLNSYGMKAIEIEEFTEKVISGQQRLLANNYAQFSFNDIKGIYSELF